MFVVSVFGLCGVVYCFYPDKPAVARRYPHNGLEAALGGKGAVPVCTLHMPVNRQESVANTDIGTRGELDFRFC